MSRPPRHDLRLIGWLSVAQLISWGSVFYTFAVLLAPVEHELGLSRAQSSLGFSLALLAEGLLAYPVGWLIDRGHERAVMTGGSLLLALGLLGHSLITGITGFYVVWLVLGIGLAATLYPPAFAVVIRRFPDDFRRGIILMTFLGGLASTVFLPLSALLIDAMGWRQALWVLAAIHLLVCAPLHAWVLRGAPAPQGLRPTTATATTATKAATRAAPQAVRPTPSALRNPTFWLVGLCIVLIMGVTAALPPHMVSLLRESGLPESWAISVPAAMGVLQVAGRLLLYFQEHQVDRHLANRLIPCLIPLGLLALLCSPWFGAAQTTLVLLFVVVYGMGNGMFTIVKGTAVAEYVDPARAASLNGALGVPMALGRAATPWLLGLLWSPAGGYASGLWLMLGLSLVGVAALVLAQQLAARPAHAR